MGSFHNYYANIGSEIESGFIDAQQGGWQWPAIYLGQDAMAKRSERVLAWSKELQ
ncbi:MAG: hypothetical protein BalsKO_04460 [Balneolaceae bacterium]